MTLNWLYNCSVALNTTVFCGLHACMVNTVTQTLINGLGKKYYKINDKESGSISQ